MAPHQPLQAQKPAADAQPVLKLHISGEAKRCSQFIIQPNKQQLAGNRPKMVIPHPPPNGGNVSPRMIIDSPPSSANVSPRIITYFFPRLIYFPYDGHISFTIVMFPLE